MTPKNLQEKIQQDPSKTWYTLKDLVQLTNAESFEIEKIVNKSDLFVRSSNSSETGEQLFTTRNDFEKKASFGTKILGAFKNRID